jgi:hypothetical protein
VNVIKTNSIDATLLTINMVGMQYVTLHSFRLVKKLFEDPRGDTFLWLDDDEENAEGVGDM